jgi:CheY-like chemotaxis protein
VSPRLLVADDDAAVVSVVRRYFTAQGFAVESCLEAGAALQRVDSGEPLDAILCDLHFTSARLAEGMGIVERARRHQPQAAVLLFTGAAEAGVAEQALRLGADGVVTKPTPLASLHQAVLRAMKRA